MSKIIIDDKEFVSLISADDVDSAIARLADKINKQYATVTEPVVLMITLSGAMTFAAQLNKHLTFPVLWAFVKCCSYGDYMTSSGDVRFDIEPTADVTGCDVLVLEDMVDSGNTWQTLHSHFSQKNVKSLRIATLLLKPDVYDKELPVDFVALEVEDKFIVGYGLDYAQRGRNLNGIYQIASR